MSFPVIDPPPFRPAVPGPVNPAGSPATQKKHALPLRIALFAVKWILILHLAYITLTSCLILLYRFANPPFTVLQPYRAIGYGWKLEKPRPLPLKSIPLYLRSMLVAVEDGKFYDHFGLDFEAFARARQINAKVGKPLYGGSTLTMQVARTLFLVPEKSYVRKYLEVIAALELEVILSKERILELYFGYAEWGSGIFGIEAASRHWYGKGVASLTRDQGARLIALLSSPIKYTPATLNKSGILRERYAYLTRRFVSSQAASPDSSSIAAPPPGGIEPGAIAAAAAEDDTAAAATAESAAGGAASGDGAGAAAPAAASPAESPTSNATDATGTNSPAPDSQSGAAAGAEPVKSPIAATP